MQRAPGFSAFSIDSLMAPTPGPRLMPGAAASFMYGGYVLFPGVGGVPFPAHTVSAGLPIDGSSLPLGLPRPGSPSVGVSATGSKASSSASTASSATENSDSMLSAFQSRVQHQSAGLLGTPLGFSAVSATATGLRGSLKPVPGPHPASSKPIPPARPGSSSPPGTPASSLSGSAYPLGLHPASLTPGGGGGGPGQYPTASSSPADLTTNSSLYKTSHKGKLFYFYWNSKYFS